jgi:hypothetical protein
MDDQVAIIFRTELNIDIDFPARVLWFSLFPMCSWVGDVEKNSSTKTYCHIYFENGLDE